MADPTTSVTTAGISIEIILMIGLAAAFVLIGLTGWVAYQAERARAKAVAAFARAEERARTVDAMATELAAARHELDRIGREAASLSADAGNAKTRIAALTNDIAKASGDLGAERGEKAALERTLERERAETRGLERQIADLKEAKEQMRLSFNETANALLQQHSENFKAQNSEQIGHLLTPLKNDIDAFKKTLGAAHLQSAEQHGSLKEQIEGLSRQSAAVSKEAENLARALKGNVQMQGAWGEMIVDTILQRLGLREGEEYTRQESFSDAEGRVRTDFIVNLPQGERLIIDSKVSLTDFEAYVNAEDDAERALRLAGHARSMRNHVKGLASKDYHRKVGTRLDFVILFVPIEAALGAALGEDDALQIEALDQKVAFATPTTLTTQMKTVAAMWRVERQHRNAEEIASRAGVLYDKFVNFIVDIEKVGERLAQAQKSYDGAIGKLSSGAGNLLRQAEMLKALGAATSKSLPSHLLDAAGASDRETLLAIEGSPAAADPESPSKSVQ